MLFGDIIVVADSWRFTAMFPQIVTTKKPDGSAYVNGNQKYRIFGNRTAELSAVKVQDSRQ